MVGRMDKGKLFQKNKKIQKIVEDLDKYTVAELDKLRFPMWMRKILIDMKEGKIDHIKTNHDMIAEIIETSIHKPDPHLEIVKYHGPQQYLGNVELLDGEIMVIIDKAILKFGYKEVPLGDTIRYSHIKYATNMDEYWKERSNEAWERNFPNESRVVEQAPTNSLNVHGVNIRKF